MGGLNNDIDKAVLKSEGAELRTRARGQHAATIEARSGVLRRALHVMEEELKKFDPSGVRKTTVRGSVR